MSLANHKPFLTSRIPEHLLGACLKARHGRSEGALSPREPTIVQLIAEGRGNKQTAAILNLSATAMRKLKVTSTAGIVRYAVRNKLVQP